MNVDESIEILFKKVQECRELYQKIQNKYFELIMSRNFEETGEEINFEKFKEAIENLRKKISECQQLEHALETLLSRVSRILRRESIRFARPEQIFELFLLRQLPKLRQYTLIQLSRKQPEKQVKIEEVSPEAPEEVKKRIREVFEHGSE